MNYLIKNGLIYDGSGDPPYYGDVFISGEIIAEIGPEIRLEDICDKGIAAVDVEVIDGAGRMITPGFIDIHRHCDIMPFTNTDFGEIELTQGITTTFVGNCGLAPVPSAASSRKELNDYLEPIIGKMPDDLVFETYKVYIGMLENAALPINMGVLAASDSIKIAVKGFGSDPYTQKELEATWDYVKEAMDLGAFGMTLGIMYQPECYSTREELAEVVRAAGTDAVLCTHIRGEGDSLVESVEEVIAVAAEAGIPLNISHFKSTGVKNWQQKIFQAIEKIESARASGQDVTADFYPYDGGSTTLQSLLPPTVMENTMEELTRSLSTPEGKKKLREELNKVHEGWDNMADSIGWDRILISSAESEEYIPLLGKTIDESAKLLGYTEPSDLAADMLVKEKGKVGIIVLSMSQEDVDVVAQLPYTMLISDSLYGGDSAHAHPRQLGSMAKFLQDFVLRRKVLTMEEAIKKMTYLPAKRMGLTTRGLLKKGYIADLLLFDPNKFQDHADYTGSHDLCTGMDLVLLGGKKVLSNGILLESGGGKLLKNSRKKV